MPESVKMVAPSRGEEVVWDKQLSHCRTNGGGALLADHNGASIMGSPRRPESSKGDDLKCGLGMCTPGWLQMFASKQAFLATFCIAWVLQGMFYTYFVSVITTIEKLFQLQSKTTGVIMSATEIGQIGSSLLLTYYGGQGHRPKWIACGMVLFAVASFTCSLPHFIFGEQLMQSRESMFASNTPASNSSTIQPSVCQAADVFSLTNASLFDPNECREEAMQEQHSQTKTTKKVLVIFFVSLLGVGMGQVAVYTLGIPYIDDNVAGRESPLYFAITIGVRILGPALGFILGSLCTLFYVDLSVDPQITPKDPRWVGAWWLGLVCISALLMLTSLAMFAFPKRLSTCRVVAPSVKKRERKNPSLKDFPKAIKRLLKNDILMFRTASSVLHILPIAGLYTFLPKYLESQFRQTAHTANMVSGIGGILVMGLGIIMSGVFILRVKPNARFVAAWIAFTAVVYAIGMGILMTIGCPMDDFAGIKIGEGFNIATFDSPCKLDCNCNTTKFNPICGTDKLTYYSPCHAGCQNYTLSKDYSMVEQFTECSCMTSEEHATERIGVCESQCNNFVWYIVLFSVFVFVHSTSEVGSMLLILRCVDPRDKAMALGLIQFAIGLFGNVPCPIVYGALVDSACLLWDTVCGKQGACRLYDTKMFRIYFHGMTGGLMLCAFFVDVIVWYKADSINFVDEETAAQDEELNPMTAKSRSETSV